MSKKISSVLLGLALLMGFTFALKAEVQNVKVGGDIEVRGIWQKDVDLIGESSKGYNFTSLPDEYVPGEWVPHVSSFVYQIARAYVSADLTDNVNAYVRFLNDRTWGTHSATLSGSDSDVKATGDAVDIDLAYIKLAEMFGYPVSLTIGRQELKYGEGFLVGDGVNDLYSVQREILAKLSDSVIAANLEEDDYLLHSIDAWKNLKYVESYMGVSIPPAISGTLPVAYVYGPRKAFDAIKFSSKYENSTIDLIKAKQSEGFEKGTDKNLYGVNWNLKTDTYGVWDFGVFSKSDNPNYKGKNLTTAFTVRGEGDIPQITVGKLHLKGELVKETGKVVVGKNAKGKEPEKIPVEDVEDLNGTYKTKNLNAWGGYVGAKYTFDNPYEPYIDLTYTRMTGDKKHSKVGTVEKFDPMYPDEKYGEIATAVLYGGNATNAKIFNAGFGIKPNEKLNVAANYYTFDEDQLALGAAVQKVKKNGKENVTNSRRLGTEWDLGVTYNYTEDVQFGLTYAQFNAGKAVTKVLDKLDIKDANSNAIVGSVKVVF